MRSGRRTRPCMTLYVEKKLKQFMENMGVLPCNNAKECHSIKRKENINDIAVAVSQSLLRKITLARGFIFLSGEARDSEAHPSRELLTAFMGFIQSR